VTGPLPRLARMMTPAIPSRITITAAIATGMSQGRRSDGGPPPDFGRGIGRRAGAEGGRTGAWAGGGSISGGGMAAAATPVPRGSGGTASPGFQTGCSIGVHVGWAGGSTGGATGSTGVAAGSGAEVVHEGAGGGLANAGGGAASGSGAGSAAGSTGAGAGGVVTLAAGGW